MLDLSDIPAYKLPEKTEKIKICGIEKEVTFKPLVGEKRLEMWALFRSDKKEETELLLDRIYLACMDGVGMTDKETAKLIDLDWEAALDLAGRVIAFTNEFEKSRKAEEEKAEKNSDPEGGTITAP